ncbi:MAG: HAMP domain-containing protein [Candidatus Omnitrophica bacterium]|nr:HAMP domain-containing protein [Candidatus Omnitrophota bacterium]
MSLFSTILVVTLSVLGFIYFSNARDILLKSKVGELRLITNLKAQQLNGYFDGLKQRAGFFQENMNLKKNLPVLVQFFDDPQSPEYRQAENALDVQLQKLINQREFFDLLLMGLDGKVVYHVNKSYHPWILGQKWDDPKGKAFEEGQIDIYFSEIFTSGAEPEEYLMPITAPVYDSEGRLAGVMALEVNMSTAYDLIRNTEGLGVTGETLLCRREGGYAIVLHPLKYDSGAAFKRKFYYSGPKAFPIRESSQGRAGAGVAALDYRGEPVIAGWRPIYIGSHLLGLVNKIDQKEAFETIHQLQKIFLIMLFIILPLSVGIVLVNAVAITDPIEKLTRAVSAVSKGAMDARVENIETNDEIADLARMFNQMTENLQKTTVRRDELLKEVDQRRHAQEAARKSSGELARSVKDLERFNQAAVGRENRMIELKRLVNELSKELGRKPPYDLSFLEPIEKKS